MSEPRRVVLLRHGRTAHNASGTIQGHLDVPLDEIGRLQAARAATVLAQASPDVVVASDLSRASDTARAVTTLTGGQLRIDPRLREVFLGTWQGLTTQEVRERFPEQYEAWRRGEDLARGGGETNAQAGARAAACVLEHLADVPDGGTLLAVTHGGTARAAVAALLTLSLAESWRFAPLGNTCWTVLVEGELGWRLERHNAGLGPLVGAATGSHLEHHAEDATDPRPGVPTSPDADPVR